jgi:glycosyltransferase involved in cell wall biosynthesis
MAVGTAVVASDIPANRELLGADQVAGSEAAAIARVRRLLLDERARARAVAEQRRRAAARGANLMAERHLALYAELLGATADPTRTAAAGT